MMTFQCKDGGWAAFDKDCTKNILEKVPFADHNAMLDPECADITARILELLGYENFSVKHPQVQRALEYIRTQQQADGSWYGRWGVNYIYGTWQVLRGLRALNLDMNQPWLLKARDWLESVQHEDGGWGERCNTYDDPVFKGHGFANRLGRHGFVRVRRPGATQSAARYRVSHPHAKHGRLLDRTRNNRHGFPESFLFEVRHVPQRLAAAGAGLLSELAQTRPRANRDRNQRTIIQRGSKLAAPI